MKNTFFRAFKGIYNALAATPLRRVPGMLAVSNIFFRAFWTKGNVISLQNMKMYIDVNDPSPALRKTFQAYGMNLVHEEATTALFKRIVRPNDVVLDLGANIGYFTLLAAHAVGPRGAVFSFEPEPHNFHYLRKNIEVNGLTNVHPFQMAVSDKTGTTNLFVCSYDSGHHTINQYQGVLAAARGRASVEQSIAVNTAKLDEFLGGKTDRVNVIKMDVEGAEALALAGMRDILKKNDVRMFLEFFPLLMKNMGSDPRMYVDSLLRDFGFTVYAIGHDYDLENAREDLIPITTYDELAAVIRQKDDHVNLYLTKSGVERNE